MPAILSPLRSPHGEGGSAGLLGALWLRLAAMFGYGPLPCSTSGPKGRRPLLCARQLSPGRGRFRPRMQRGSTGRSSPDPAPDSARRPVAVRGEKSRGRVAHWSRRYATTVGPWPPDLVADDEGAVCTRDLPHRRDVTGQPGVVGALLGKATTRVARKFGVGCLEMNHQMDCSRNKEVGRFEWQVLGRLDGVRGETAEYAG